MDDETKVALAVTAVAAFLLFRRQNRQLARTRKTVLNLMVAMDNFMDATYQSEIDRKFYQIVKNYR